MAIRYKKKISHLHFLIADVLGFKRYWFLHGNKAKNLQEFKVSKYMKAFALT